MIEFPPFLSTGIRLIEVLERKKDGFESSRVVKRIITDSRSGFRRVISQLEEDMLRGQRLYVSVNPRNLRKAIYDFKQKQLQADYTESEDFYLDIKNRFFSSLARSKDDSLFLFDIDNVDAIPDSFYENIKKADVKILWSVKTVTGFHVITFPFNHTVFDWGENISIETDGLVLIHKS